MRRAAGSRDIFGDGGKNAAVAFADRHDINSVAQYCRPASLERAPGAHAGGRVFGGQGQDEH
jgi:hypothetical protein